MNVRELQPDEAARELAGLAELDPRGIATEADTLAMCRDAFCFELATDKGRAVLAVHVLNGTAWVEAAGGGGDGAMCQAIDQALPRLPGVRAVAFQTKRPGLVRRAERLGYRVTGYILRRDL